jgi:hypothetical protein
MTRLAQLALLAGLAACSAPIAPPEAPLAPSSDPLPPPARDPLLAARSAASFDFGFMPTAGTPLVDAGMPDAPVAFDAPADAPLLPSLRDSSTLAPDAAPRRF